MSFLKSLELIKSREISIEDFISKTKMTYQEILNQFEYDYETQGAEDSKREWRDLYRGIYEYYKDGVKIEERRRPLEPYEEKLVGIRNLRFKDVSKTIDLYLTIHVFKKEVYFGPYDTYDDIMTYSHMGYLIGQEQSYPAGEHDLVPEYSKDPAYIPDLIQALGYVDIHFFKGKYFVRNEAYDVSSYSLPRALAKLLFKNHYKKCLDFNNQL